MSASLRTAQKFIDQFGTLDTTTLSTILTDNYHHEFAPSSIPSLPGPFDKAGFLAHHSKLQDTMTSFPVIAKETIDNPAANQVTIWATSHTVFREDVKDYENGMNDEEWTYRGEYVFMLWMEEGGERVTRCVEFLDSLGTKRLRALMKRARENRRKRLGIEDRGGWEDSK